MVRTSKIPTLVGELEAFRQEALRDAANFLKDRMKDTIEKQTESSWAPLSLVTLRKKFPETRKLFEKGNLVDAIKAEIGTVEATIGIHKNEKRWEIGIFQEYGAPRAGIPSRSFIRSTWAKYQLAVKARIEAIFIRKTKVGK